jgi:hypothetical protein
MACVIVVVTGTGCMSYGCALLSKRRSIYMTSVCRDEQAAVLVSLLFEHRTSRVAGKRANTLKALLRLSVCLSVRVTR